MCCDRFSGKKEIARELIDIFVDSIGQIWGGMDAEDLLDQYKEGKAFKPPVKKSARQNAKAEKLKEAGEAAAKAQSKLERLKPDLVGRRHLH